MVTLDGLKHLPRLVVAQVGAHFPHVLDAPDKGDFAALGEIVTEALKLPKAGSFSRETTRRQARA